MWKKNGEKNLERTKGTEGESEVNEENEREVKQGVRGEVKDIIS